MSEPDAENAEDTDDGGPATDDAGGEEPGGSAEAAETVEEIADAPSGDVEHRLREIAAEGVAFPDVPEAAESVAEDAVQRADIEVDDALIDRIESTDAREVAVEIATLQRRVGALEDEADELRTEVDDLESRLARKQADFQNYKQRQQRRLEDEKARATEGLVERLLDVRDNLQRALDQEDGTDIRSGVASTLRQFDAELDRENVTRIDPEPGEEVDPQRHEVLMRVESERPRDAVVDVHRPGYEMAEKVLRPAQVTVSEGAAADEGPGSEEADTTATEDA